MFTYETIEREYWTDFILSRNGEAIGGFHSPVTSEFMDELIKMLNAASDKFTMPEGV